MCYDKNMFIEIGMLSQQNIEGLSIVVNYSVILLDLVLL